MGNVWKSDYKNFSLSIDDMGFDIGDEANKKYTEILVQIWNEGMSQSKFRLNKFFNQVATGTGVGLRYDLDFFVVRVDWGFGLHLPYETGKSGYLNIPHFRDMHSLHLAIGYPF